MNPIIFAGHVGLSEEDAAAQEDLAQDGRVFEINFNQQAHFLEGIHIVPKDISPPLGFEFQGQTAPDMTSRPFTLEMYVRDIDQPLVLKKVLGPVVVSGGVHWMPIVQPPMAVDYVAIKGDFERLSLIIHGGPILPGKLSESATAVMENGMPIPPGFVSSEVEASDDAEYDSDEDGSPGVQGSGDRMVRLAAVLPPKVYDALNFPTNSINESQRKWEPPKAGGIDFCRRLPLRASIESVTALVESIFSVGDLGVLRTQPVQKQIEKLESISINLLSAAASGAATSSENPDCPLLSASLGDDAASVLVGISIKYLSFILSSNISNSSVSDFLSLSKAVLDLARAVSHNDFTAIFFHAQGGVSTLAKVVGLEPPLPSSLHQLAIEALESSIKNTIHLTDDATTISAAHKALLGALRVMKRPSVAIKPCVSALNWCAFVQSTRSLGQLSERSVSLLEGLSQTVAMHLSIASSSGTATAGTDSSSNNIRQLSQCGQQLADLHAEFKEGIGAFQGSLVAVVTDSTQQDNGEDSAAILRAQLHGANIVSVLVALAALARALEEQAALDDWASPQARDLNSLANGCYGLLESTVRLLFTLVEGAVALFGERPRESQLFFEFLAADEHLLASQPLEELLDEHASYTPGSLGWLANLSCHASVIAQQLATLPDPQNSQALSDLCELASFPSGASVVAQVTCQFCLPQILELLSTTADDQFAGKVLDVLEVCLLSDVPLVLRKMIKSWPRISSQLTALIASNRAALVERASQTLAQMECGKGLTTSLELLTMCRKDVVSAVGTTTTTSMTTTAALTALEVPLRVISQASSEAEFAAIALLHNEDAGKLFEGALELMRTATALARGSLDANSTEGYEDSFFVEFQRSDDNSSSPDVSVQGRIDRVRVLTRTILTCLNFVRNTLSLLHAHNKKALSSEELFSTLLEANSLAHSFLGGQKTGFLGSSARRISATVESILSLYCPPSSWSHSCHLVPFLVGKLLHSPRLMLSNIALLTALLPDGRRSGDDKSLRIDDLSHTWGCSAQNLARRIQSASFLSEQNAAVSSDRSMQDEEVWHDFLTRRPLFTSAGGGRSFILPFSLGRGDVKATSPTDASLERSVDPLRLVKQAVLEGRCDLEALLGCAVLSTSREIHTKVLELCHRCMSVSADLSTSLACVLIDLLNNTALLHLHAPSSVDFESMSALCRSLLVVHDLCCLDTPCVVLVAEGLLLPLFAALHSTHQQVVILALQALASCYRVLSRVAAQSQSLSSSVMIDSSDDDAAAAIKEGATLTLQAVAEGLLALLPSITSRFQTSSMVIAQTIFCVNQLPLRYVKGFVDALSATNDFEVVSVKLWLFFEDTFQAFTSLVEAAKSLSSDDVQETLGEDHGVEAIAAAHAQLAASASALSYATELVVLAYAKNWIPLTTMNRAMRSAITEPRKIALRYQRAYTMWSTDRKQSYSPGPSGESSNEFPLPPLHIDTQLDRTDFDARHALVAASLRHIVEACRKHHEYVKGGLTRDDVGGGADAAYTSAVSSNSSSDPLLFLSSTPKAHGLDLSDPFAPVMGPRQQDDDDDDDEDEDEEQDAQHQQRLEGKGSKKESFPSPATLAWFEICSSFSTRTANSFVPAHRCVDALHALLRRALIVGDEANASIFEIPEAFVRLKALPRLADPGADKRRRERRQKRRAERAAEAKAAAASSAETARVAAAEAEEKRLRQAEEDAQQREREQQEAAMARAENGPQIQIAGVPKHLLSKFNAANATLMPRGYPGAPGPGPGAGAAAAAGAAGVGSAPPQPPLPPPSAPSSHPLPPPPPPVMPIPPQFPGGGGFGGFRVPPMPPVPPPFLGGGGGAGGAAPSGRGRGATLPAWMTQNAQ